MDWIYLLSACGFKWMNEKNKRMIHRYRTATKIKNIHSARRVRASRSVESAKQSSFWLLLAAHVESGVNTQLIASIKHLFWLLVDELMPRVQLTTLGVRPLHRPFRCNPWNITSWIINNKQERQLLQSPGFILASRGPGGRNEAIHGTHLQGELKICVNWCTSVDVLENESIFINLSVCTAISADEGMTVCYRK